MNLHIFKNLNTDFYFEFDIVTLEEKLVVLRKR